MIFSGLDWCTMLAALDDVTAELERTARELRRILDRHRPIGLADAAGLELERGLETIRCDLAGGAPGAVRTLELVSEPIPGRAGWRRDGAGREWYSDAWLDGPGAA